MHSILSIFQRGTNRKPVLAAGQDVGVPPKPVPITVNNECDSKLYALIIGINAYQKLKPLTGAVADGTAMQEFLTTDLKVPPNHIINLRDSQATREGIVQAFRRIRDDPRIHKGDPILIFYAGHGGLGTAPPEWKEKYGYDEIQVIFPYDYSLAQPGSKEPVNCIPDRTIGILLNELAVAKGDNVTVIFDSCHSASGSRDWTDETVPGRIAREAESRILFNSRVPSRKITFIPVTRERDTWILQAGAASGVTFGSIWELHVKPTEDSKALGQLQAHTPHVSSTALGPESGDISAPAPAGLGRFSGDRLYARQIRSGTGQELRVYFSPEAESLIFRPGGSTRMSSTTEMRNHEVGYVVHPTRDSADLVVEVRCPGGPEPEIEYTLCDPQAQKYGVAKLEQRTRARLDEVERVLFAAARWNWHLKRTSPSARSKSIVSMELVKLGVKYSDFMVPVDGPLENLNKTGAVDLKARVEDQYGIRLSSRAPIALYVQVFYFDMSDFSIVNMFAYSQAQGRADPELPMHGQFMIGDESDGGAPLSFGLDQGEKLDVGFIKVFWSTDPLELSNMAQGSAFEAPEREDDESRKVVVQAARTAKEWGTILVTLVQRA
ncbi:hypothetical protein FRC06_000897 [Ceratobasidium sp. 370]|nr:hypothetical protein FRC06_000897 [Ceratobasidium sp. 370]